MAPSAPGVDKAAPVNWGRLIASMFKFKLVKRHIGTKYLRVRRCVLEDLQVRVADEEPIGVTIARNPAVPKTNFDGTITNDVYWTKVGSQWISSDQRDGVFLRAEPITEAEYGTDLAFGLWPELKTTNRPFRAWVKLNKMLLKKWNATFAVVTVSSITYFVSKSDGMYDNWFYAGLIAALVATVTTVIFMVTNKWDRS